MKRLFMVIVASALVAGACGSDTTSDTTSVPRPEVTSDSGVIASGGPEDLAITEIVFDDHFTITNLGSEPVNVEGLWLCNRPNYVPLPPGVIAPGESIEISDLVTASNGGEVALYRSNSFGDPEALIDYVGWGNGGGRSSVAADAGLWPEGETVTSTGSSISAPNGGDAAADWS